jgi:Tfp pilus assembly protein PilF
MVLVRAGNCTLADIKINETMRGGSDTPDVWLAAARIRMAQGRWDQAANMAQKALTLAPGDRPVHAAVDRLIQDLQKARHGTSGCA